MRRQRRVGDDASTVFDEARRLVEDVRRSRHASPGPLRDTVPILGVDEISHDLGSLLSSTRMALLPHVSASTHLPASVIPAPYGSTSGIDHVALPSWPGLDSTAAKAAKAVDRWLSTQGGTTAAAAPQRASGKASMQLQSTTGEMPDAVPFARASSHRASAAPAAAEEHLALATDADAQVDQPSRWQMLTRQAQEEAFDAGAAGLAPKLGLSPTRAGTGITSWLPINDRRVDQYDKSVRQEAVISRQPGHASTTDTSLLRDGGHDEPRPGARAATGGVYGLLGATGQPRQASRLAVDPHTANLSPYERAVAALQQAEEQLLQHHHAGARSPMRASGPGSSGMASGLGAGRAGAGPASPATAALAAAERFFASGTSRGATGSSALPGASAVAGLAAMGIGTVAHPAQAHTAYPGQALAPAGSIASGPHAEPGEGTFEQAARDMLRRLSLSSYSTDITPASSSALPHHRAPHAASSAASGLQPPYNVQQYQHQQQQRRRSGAGSLLLDQPLPTQHVAAAATALVAASVAAGRTHDPTDARNRAPGDPMRTGTARPGAASISDPAARAAVVHGAVAGLPGESSGEGDLLPSLELQVALQGIMAAAERATTEEAMAAERERRRQEAVVAAEAEAEAREAEAARLLRAMFYLRLWGMGARRSRCELREARAELQGCRLRRLLRAWHHVARCSRVEALAAGALELAEERRKEQIAAQFRRLWLLHVGLQRWRDAAAALRRERQEQELAAVEVARQQQAEALREAAADRFRRLWLQHSAFRTWRAAARARAMARSQAAAGPAGSEQQRRVAVGQLLSRLRQQREAFLLTHQAHPHQQAARPQQQQSRGEALSGGSHHRVSASGGSSSHPQRAAAGILQAPDASHPTTHERQPAAAPAPSLAAATGVNAGAPAPVRPFPGLNRWIRPTHGRPPGPHPRPRTAQPAPPLDDDMASCSSSVHAVWGARPCTAAAPAHTLAHEAARRAPSPAPRQQPPRATQPQPFKLSTSTRARQKKDRTLAACEATRHLVAAAGPGAEAEVAYDTQPAGLDGGEAAWAPGAVAHARTRPGRPGAPGAAAQVRAVPAREAWSGQMHVAESPRGTGGAPAPADYRSHAAPSLSRSDSGRSSCDGQGHCGRREGGSELGLGRVPQGAKDHGRHPVALGRRYAAWEVQDGKLSSEGDEQQGGGSGSESERSPGAPAARGYASIRLDEQESDGPSAAGGATCSSAAESAQGPREEQVTRGLSPMPPPPPLQQQQLDQHHQPLSAPEQDAVAHDTSPAYPSLQHKQPPRSRPRSAPRGVRPPPGTWRPPSPPAEHQRPCTASSSHSPSVPPAHASTTRHAAAPPAAATAAGPRRRSSTSGKGVIDGGGAGGPTVTAEPSWVGSEWSGGSGGTAGSGLAPLTAADLQRLHATEVRRRRQADEQAARVAAELAQHTAHLAAVHHRRALLRWCGLVPWMRLVESARQAGLVADQHANDQRLRRAFMALCRAVLMARTRRVARVAAAVARGRTRRRTRLASTVLGRLSRAAAASGLHRRHLALRGLVGLMRAASAAWEARADAEDHAARYRLWSCLRGWRRAAEEQASARLLWELQRQHDAEAALGRLLLRRVLRAWRGQAAEAEQQRAALRHRRQQWAKVQGWLHEVECKRRRSTSRAEPPEGPGLAAGQRTSLGSESPPLEPPAGCGDSGEGASWRSGTSSPVSQGAHRSYGGAGVGCGRAAGAGVQREDGAGTSTRGSAPCGRAPALNSQGSRTAAGTSGADSPCRGSQDDNAGNSTCDGNGIGSSAACGPSLNPAGDAQSTPVVRGASGGAASVAGAEAGCSLPVGDDDDPLGLGSVEDFVKGYSLGPSGLARQLLAAAGRPGRAATPGAASAGKRGLQGCSSVLEGRQQPDRLGPASDAHGRTAAADSSRLGPRHVLTGSSPRVVGGTAYVDEHGGVVTLQAVRTGANQGARIAGEEVGGRGTRGAAAGKGQPSEGGEEDADSPSLGPMGPAVGGRDGGSASSMAGLIPPRHERLAKYLQERVARKGA